MTVGIILFRIFDDVVLLNSCIRELSQNDRSMAHTILECLILYSSMVKSLK